VSIFRLSAQVLGRSSGRSATGAAAYRAAERIADARTGLEHDYRRKRGVLHTEILAPKNAPAWARDRSTLWNAVEQKDKRKDSQLCREILLSLPHELTDEQRRDVVREFVQDQFVSRGMIADIAIHAAHHKGDQRNHHAHVLLTMRHVSRDGFGNKNREWDDKALMPEWRKGWAQYQNRALERAGRPERVDHRSLAERGFDREPEPKVGPMATKIERAGGRSQAGSERRAVQARNAERARLYRRVERLKALMIAEQNRIRADQHRKIEQHKVVMVSEQRRQKRVAREEVSVNKTRAAEQDLQLEIFQQREEARQQERDALEARLAEFYDPHIEQHRRELDAIQQRTKRKGQGSDARAAALQKSIKDAENRKQEARDALAAVHATERGDPDVTPAGDKSRYRAADTPALRRRLADRMNRAEVWKAVIESRTKGEARFQEWAANKRAELHAARLEAQQRQTIAHSQERDALETRLARQYGDARDAQQRQLDQIKEQRSKRATGGVLSRLIGQRNNGRIEALERSIEQTDLRMNEARQTLDRQQQREVQQLTTNHDIFGRSLEAEIDRARDSGIPDKSRGLESEQSRDNDDGGRERGIER
jgi:hypothetical protein